MHYSRSRATRSHRCALGARRLPSWKRIAWRRDSKGDDDRDPAEIEAFRRRDALAVALEEAGDRGRETLADVDLHVSQAVEAALAETELSLGEYVTALPEAPAPVWVELERIDRRQVDLINEFFHATMESDSSMIFIGEDVLSPYGGAFKVARGLS